VVSAGLPVASNSDRARRDEDGGILGGAGDVLG